MRKKLLSILTAVTLSAALLPQSMSAAAEKYPRLKFGLSKGDIVSLGSNDSKSDDGATVYYTAPQKFLVLNADKSSTGSDGGAFLITSDTTARDVEVRYSRRTTEAECSRFLKIFNDEEQKLILSTTKESTSIIDTYELTDNITDKKMFLLSGNEVTEYANMLKASSGKSWLLRSGKTETSFMGTITKYYMGIVDGNNQLSVDLVSNVGTILATHAFRPGMNISKENAAVGTPFGSKVLLLPSEQLGTGSFSSAYASTRQSYILPVKDSGIGEIKPQTTSIDGNNYSISVAAERSDGAAPDNEYISFIITDTASENILYFGRFKKTGSGISLTLPSAVNAQTCKVYAFNEIYTPGKVSKISSLAEVCLKHDFSRAEDGAGGVHTAICKNCGYSEEHRYTITSNGDDSHTLTCGICNYSGTGQHDMKFSSADSENHTITCTLCGYAKQATHDIGYKSSGSEVHEKYCRDNCGYSEQEEHGEFTYENITGSSHRKKCGLCGYDFGVYTHGMDYIDDGEDGHILRCRACGYETKSAHSYGSWKDKGETHERICSGCERVQSAEHSLTKDAASVDQTKHKVYCADCGAEKIAEHDFEYISYNDGTHDKVCKVCGAKIKERHTFKFVNTGAVFSRLKCSVCSQMLNIEAVASSISGDYSKRDGAVDLASVKVGDCGSAWSGYSPENLFNHSMFDFKGTAHPVSGTRYMINVDFAMTHPVALTGFMTVNGYDDETYPARMPKYISISGKNDGDADYTAIAAVGIDGFVPVRNRAACTYFIKGKTAAYKYYRIELENTQSDIQLGDFFPLSTKGTEAEFDLSGVIAENKHDLVVPGEDYECMLVSKRKHPSKDNVFVKFNSESFEDYTYSEETGILHIDGDKIQSGTYKISATAENEPVNVKTELFRLSFSGADTANFNENYSGYFLDNNRSKKKSSATGGYKSNNRRRRVRRLCL